MKHSMLIHNCPACGSEEVTDFRIYKNGFLNHIALFVEALPFLHKKYLCSDCGNVFKNGDIAQIIRK